MCAGIELSADPSRGALSPYVSAGFVWAVRQSVYASNRSHDVTNSSLGSAINDVCHFLLSKVSPIAGSHLYGVFGMYVLSSHYHCQPVTGLAVIWLLKVRGQSLG